MKYTNPALISNLKSSHHSLFQMNFMVSMNPDDDPSDSEGIIYQNGCSLSALNRHIPTINEPSRQDRVIRPSANLKMTDTKRTDRTSTKSPYRTQLGFDTEEEQGLAAGKSQSKNTRHSEASLSHSPGQSHLRGQHLHDPDDSSMHSMRVINFPGRSSRALIGEKGDRLSMVQKLSKYSRHRGSSYSSSSVGFIFCSIYTFGSLCLMLSCFFSQPTSSNHLKLLKIMFWFLT